MYYNIYIEKSLTLSLSVLPSIPQEAMLISFFLYLKSLWETKDHIILLSFPTQKAYFICCSGPGLF